MKEVCEITRKFITPLLPSEIEGERNLDRAEELQREGYGIVVLHTHFSSRDSIQVLKDLILKNKLIQNKEVVFPIEERLYDNSKFILEPLIRNTQIKLCPMVTQASLKYFDSKQQKKYEKAQKARPDLREKLIIKLEQERKELLLKQKQHQTSYFKTAVDVLGRGGVVIESPQTTRRSQLFIPEKYDDRTSPVAVSTLIAHLDHKSLDKVAFLFIGLGIKDIKNYTNKNFLNLDKKYIDRIGPVYTKNELEKISFDQSRKNTGNHGNTLRGIEKTVAEELGKLVPPEYLKSPFS